MEEYELIERITACEEASVLLECSKRAKRRFGLRGGLLRNLLLSEQGKASLFDSIDPFSNLHCVLERREDWPELSSTLASSLAYAGFYRWEVETLRRIDEDFRNYPTLPSERLIAWFDGTSEKAPVLIESRGGDLESGLSPEQYLTAFPVERLNLSFWDRVLVVLARMRTLYQFVAEPVVGGILENFKTADIPEIPPTPLTVERLKILLAGLAMSSIRLPSALVALKELDHVTRGAIEQRGGQIGRVLLGWSIDNSSRVTASVCGGRSGRRRVDLQVATENFANDRIGSRRPLIPWTLLRSHYDPGCCEYRDFGSGVGVVASRGGNAPSLQQLKGAEILALPIEESMKGNYRFNHERALGMESLPLPGILSQSAQGTVLRVDHSFPGAYLSRPVSFLTSALALESAQ